MGSETKKPLADREFPLGESDAGVFEDYANVTDFDWSLTDVTLRFMQIAFALKEEGPTTKNRELVYLEKANITLPWWQAKVLAINLSNLVRSYESVNGELNEPLLTPHPLSSQPKAES